MQVRHRNKLCEGVSLQVAPLNANKKLLFIKVELVIIIYIG